MALYNLFDDTPSLGSSEDGNAANLGTEFYVTAPHWVTEIRYLQPAYGALSAQDRTAGLFSTTSGSLVAGPFNITAPEPGAWGVVALPTPYALEPDRRYRVVVHHPGGQYAAMGAYFTGADQRKGGLVIPSAGNATAGGQGSYGYSVSLGYPTQHFNDTAYYSDVTVTDTDPNGPPPVLEADVSLEVEAPRGNSLSVRYTPNTPLTVSAPCGYVLTTSEAKQ